MGARLGAVGWHSWRKDFSFLPLMVQQIGQIGKPAPGVLLRGFLALPVRNETDKKCRDHCGIATAHQKKRDITIS